MLLLISALRRRSVRLLAAIGFLVALAAQASAQSPPGDGQPLILSQPPLVPAFGGRADGGPVLSPYIDKLAFNARADFLILADTPQRRQAFLIPYGFSFAVAHLVEGGILASHAFWKVGDQRVSVNGPLSLNLKVRLWPLFASDPNQNFTIVAAYQHEVRTGPFIGVNQLGLPENLAALRVAASWPVWLFDIGASVGALYDYQGRFAAGELGARIGVRLDILSLKDTRASVEGIVRGLPAYSRSDADFPGAADLKNPIHLSGALFLGINTRMTRTSDFGIWIQKGFGDVAPLSFGVRVFGIFIGDGYLRPRPIWVDVVKELATWVHEQIAAVDPVLRSDCVIYDKDQKEGMHAPDGKPMGRFGRLSDDGRFCEGSDGFRAPINVDLWRDPKGHLLCWDDDFKDCLLRRDGDRWVPIHRPRLNADCILIDSDGRWMDKLGTPSSDKKTCHWDSIDQHGRRVPYDLEVGRLYHYNSDRQRVCYDEDPQSCFVDRKDRPQRWNGHEQAGASLKFGFSDLGDSAKKAVKTGEDVASGRVHLDTIAEHAGREAESALSRCGKEKLECAKNVFQGALELGKEGLRDASDWWDAPSQEKINGAARSAPGTALGAVVGGATKVVGGAVEHELEKAVANAATHKAAKAAVKRAGKEAAAEVAEHEGAVAAKKMVNEAVAAEAKLGAEAGTAEATGFLGRKGFELKNRQELRHTADVIGGRPFSGHALDQMQNRGVMPSVVENTIQTGRQFAGNRPDTVGYFDPVNKIRVIVNSKTGNVITVISGGP